MIYKIFTESKNVRWIKQLISSYCIGFSMWKVNGFWDGKYEKSLCIEIDIGEEDLHCSIKEICRSICIHNEQSSVLCQQIECNSRFITVSG